MSPVALTADPEHTFQVVFAIPHPDSFEIHLDALRAVGAEDAAFVGPAADGTFTAEFDREAPTFPAAVVSALDALQSALQGVRLLRILPDDLVTIAAIAIRTGRTDESIRLITQGRRGPGGFPFAAGFINEKTRVWRWTDVARWFSEALDEAPAGAEHAAFLAALNDALDLGARADDLRDRPEELAAIRKFLPDDLAVT